jgi:sugar phosphate isomerase/epimerase
MKLGVSLYSYQQSIFFNEMTLEDQIREVSENLPGADGIEIVDEMSLRYPDPGDAFVAQWQGWMERYGTKPVTMDVSMDVLQFRDHVMNHDEVAERLQRDIRLAKRLGFAHVRVLSVCPLDVMIKALPLAEKLNIPLGKEVHQPMALEGRQVTEIIDFAEKHGTQHLGIVPDFGIFGFRPSEAMLAWYERKGAKPEASMASVELATRLRTGNGPFDFASIAKQTAGNLRAAYKRFLNSGEAVAELLTPFKALNEFARQFISQPTDLDYTVVAEAIMLSNTSFDTMRQLAGHVVSVHAKFNHMSEIQGRPGQFHDMAIDTAGAVKALKAGGYKGYLNSEYEGQRYWQDRTRADMMDEVAQVRLHQSMLRQLIAE